jgi:hypothetical protein
MDDIPLKKNVTKNKESKHSLENTKSEEFNSFKSFKTQIIDEQRVNFGSEHFPELVVNPKKVIETIELKYIEKLKKVDETRESIDPDLEYLKPGWVLLKRDPLTGRTIIKQHPEICIEKKEKEKTENEIAIDILNRLVESYKKRTQEYIENYGYEEWERMFKFPNWREDEAYLEQIDETLDYGEQEENDYDDNYEENSDYNYDYSYDETY